LGILLSQIKWGKVVGNNTKMGESGDIVFPVDPECGLLSTAAIHGKASSTKVCEGSGGHIVRRSTRSAAGPKGSLGIACIVSSPFRTPLLSLHWTRQVRGHFDRRGI